MGNNLSYNNTLSEHQWYQLNGIKIGKLSFFALINEATKN